MADELPDIKEQHAVAVRLGYEKGPVKKGGRHFKYNNNALTELCDIRLASQDDEAAGRPLEKQTYQAKDYALVNVRSKDGDLKGEAYAYSVARILGVFEDKNGYSFVALHYFWRWGQIHANYDLHPATRPVSPHQIFLQKEILKDKIEINGQLTNTPVRYKSSNEADDGKFVELLPACELMRPIIVRHKSQYQDSQSLADYENRYKDRWDEDTDTPASGFWFDSTFDHSCYAFEQCNAEGNPVEASERIPQEQLTLLDAYCGCGTVSLAANTVGITVVGGIDNNRDAISSFAANTSSTVFGGFNPGSQQQPLALHKTVQDAVAEIKSKQLLLPPVTVLHASPPCQDVSSKKKREARVITGAETMAVVDLVKCLEPAYVTLEEVPSFVAQKFLKSNLRGPLAGWPDQSTPPPPPPAAEAVEAADNDEEAEEGDEDVLDYDENNSPELTASTEAAAAASPDNLSDNEVVFSMLLLIVPQLLSLEYTVKVGFLQASDYGVPQARLRMFLMATKRHYQPAELPAPWCQRPTDLSRQPLAVDPNFCLREGVPAKWYDVLEVSPDPEAAASLLPYTTVAESIGDLSPLLPGASGKNRLGLEDAQYHPELSAVFRCPLPVDGLKGCEPSPRYGVYMRSPHTEHQAKRLCNTFQPGRVLDHVVEYSSPAISKLLNIRSDKPGPGERETEAEAAARQRAGHRVAADGLAACVMGHNEPRKQCLHFLEDRMVSILERRRFQSMPDWLQLRGDHKPRQQQVGNAVPYLLAVAVMGEVFAAATGEPPYRPPWPLHGPCLEGCGMPAAATATQRRQYKQWGHTVHVAEQQRVPGSGWTVVLQNCRQLLGQDASVIKGQQQQQYLELSMQGNLDRGSQQQQQQLFAKRAAAGSSKRDRQKQQQQQHYLVEAQGRQSDAAQPGSSRKRFKQQQQHVSATNEKTLCTARVDTGAAAIEAQISDAFCSQPQVQLLLQHASAG